ncbi:cation diffusion facilitator family transporter [Halobacillus litoralis]|uniref:Cation diffusion facilitator family transporter n=1 Tax=Halobacillus litoralis TaxID=45668 RepID=A0A845DL29_9BACI|nr:MULTISPECIES: cation diffusion facilitator family transporter [Halobacillus]MYL18351.1 cation diffusion facilitator family transporter [Halobacillus litoralis]MYL30642.1 cation diffusion facilitator family transporter [Halobacillus halophilus]MYL38659.1 cation diffusion facilitator family transporter [Halobacillus litoralis]
MSEYENLKRGERGAWVSIVAYLVLASVKLLIAYTGQSEALRADGLNNTTDVVASIAVLVGLKISRKPPDEDHHYGHFRAETIASLIAAFIMMTVGIEVIIGTVQDLINQETSQPSLLTAWTALGAAGIMFGVYRYNLNLSQKVNSPSLYAAAQDNRSDALVSIGACVGIFGAQFGLFWLDPLAGFIVGLIICKTAWDIFKEATHSLTDGYEEGQLEHIRSTISNHPEVWAVKDVKARLQGSQTLVEATIHVDPHITIQQGHDITDEVEALLKKQNDIRYAHIHIEPYEE